MYSVGFRVQGSGCRVQGSGFWIKGLGFRAQLTRWLSGETLYAVPHALHTHGLSPCRDNPGVSAQSGPSLLFFSSPLFFRRDNHGAREYQHFSI